jgi:hypothetical protein
LRDSDGHSRRGGDGFGRPPVRKFNKPAAFENGKDQITVRVYVRGLAAANYYQECVAGLLSQRPMRQLLWLTRRQFVDLQAQLIREVVKILEFAVAGVGEEVRHASLPFCPSLRTSSLDVLQKAVRTMMAVAFPSGLRGGLFKQPSTGA